MHAWKARSDKKIQDMVSIHNEIRTRSDRDTNLHNWGHEGARQGSMPVYTGIFLIVGPNVSKHLNRDTRLKNEIGRNFGKICATAHVFIPARMAFSKRPRKRRTGNREMDDRRVRRRKRASGRPILAEAPPTCAGLPSPESPGPLDLRWNLGGRGRPVTMHGRGGSGP